MRLTKTNAQSISSNFLEIVSELIKNSAEAENLKWELLRQNSEYQLDYDNFEKKIKTMSCEDDVHYLEKQFIVKYGMSYLKDYKDEIKPCEELFGYFLEGLMLLPDSDDKKKYISEYEESLFNLNRKMFYPIGPYSLNDLRDSPFINPIHEYITSTEGFFSYLDTNKKNLMTITFDISKNYTEHEFELLTSLLRRQIKINYDVKTLELTKDKARILSYLDMIKLSNANLTHEEIYNVLLGQNLVPVHKGDDLDSRSRKRSLVSQKIIYAKDYLKKLNPLVKVQIPEKGKKYVRKREH